MANTQLALVFPLPSTALPLSLALPSSPPLPVSLP